LKNTQTGKGGAVIRAEIVEIKSRKVKRKDVDLPKRVELIAENKDEEILLSYIVKMSSVDAFKPTMKKMQEMIREGILEQDGKEWKFNMHKVMQETTPDIMFG